MVKCVGSFVLFGELSADHLDGSGKGFGGRRARTQERITVAHRPGQGLRSKSAEPDRRMRPLHRLGLDGKVVDVAEPAVERHLGLVRPGRLHQLQALGEIADERVLVHPEGGELAGPAARRDADVQPAVTEPVDGRDGRRQLQRVVQRGHQHGDTQAAGARCRRRNRPAAPAVPAAVRRRWSARVPSRPRSRAPQRAQDMRAARRRRSHRSRVGGWRSRTSLHHRTAADR